MKAFELAYFARRVGASLMLQGLLVRTLEHAPLSRGGDAAVCGRTRLYVLDTRLVELRQDFTSNPGIVQLVSMELRDSRTQRILAARQFEAREPMHEASPEAGAIAANAATALPAGRHRGLRGGVGALAGHRARGRAGSIRRKVVSCITSACQSAAPTCATSAAIIA